MKIGEKEITKNNTFIIAEIGNNHNGDFDIAIKMIDQAIEIGVDCVKFQMRNLSEVYRKKSLDKTGEDLGSEYIIDLLNRFELTTEEHFKLFKYCSSKDITYLCTPWDKKSIEILENFGVVAYKVASADLTNIPLLELFAETKKPLILSTGMSTEQEIKITVDYLNKKNCQFTLLHCNSTYPAPFHDIHLNWINSLRKYHKHIGYSGHERGINISIAAVALGAEIIERHLTINRKMEGPDHAASLELSEFSQLVKGIRQVEQALGDINGERKLSQGEMINRENLGKSLVASRNIKKGEVINKSDIKAVSPGQGISPQFFQQLIGKVTSREMKEEDYFFLSDIEGKKRYKNNFDFSLKWGIPVRYHDFKEFDSLINPDLFEFHLSYSDMNLELDDYLTLKSKCGYVVHAPELFEGGHLMDLTSSDYKYLKYSIEQTQRVINITRKINSYFPKQKTPQIVANIGGFSMDEPFSEAKKKEHYKIFFESLNNLDTEGGEIIPHTMAPFPWHFGGQRYQNLFVHPDEIVQYCKEYNIRICFDVSHSMLISNHFKYNFYEFAEKVAPHTAHIHMGDASGLNGEGLQIGEGEIDFNRLGKILKAEASNSTFIPEIWQGHKNNGEGFWLALEKLESII